MSDPERYEVLLMKAVDGLLEEPERAELERLLDGHPERRAELEDMTAVKSITDAFSERLIADARIEPPRAPQRSLSLGALLVTLGLALAVGAAAARALTDPATPTATRVAIGLVAAGVTLILGRLVATRLRHPDPYQEIDL